MLWSRLAAARGPSPTLKQWAWWKEPGLRLVPSLFLPANKNESRILQRFLSSTIDWPGTHRPVGEGAVATLPHARVNAHNANPVGERVVKGMVPRVQSGWMRVLREGNGSQARENKTVFFFFFSSLVDLNAPSRSAAFAPQQQASHHTHTHTRYKTKDLPVL